MDPKELFSLVASKSDEPFELNTETDPERFSTTQVWGTWNGHDLRFDFTDTASSPAEYRYNATVYEVETGKQIATGNGGATWAEAFEIVHWQELENFAWAH